MEKINPLAGKESRACSGRSGFITAALLIMVFSTISTAKLSGQTTYTWDGSTGDNLWTTAANWTPDRTTPAASDIIHFNTGSNLTVLDVPNAHYIYRMRVTSNTSVTLKPLTTPLVDGEIFVTANDDSALYVAVGSTLTITGRDIAGDNENILMFNLAASPANIGAKIEGTLKNALDNNNLSAHGMYQRKGTTQLFNFKTGSVYEQAINGGYIPVGTWEAGSTCLITGMVDFRPAFIPADVYADIIWNSPGQTGLIDLQGNLRTVNGNFHVISTGSSAINFGQYVSTDLTINGDYIQEGGSVAIAPFDASSFSRKMTVGGDFTLSAGTVQLCPRYSTGILEIDGKFTSAGNFYFHQTGYNASATINAAGDCEISGGTFNMSSAASSLGVLNVKGNFSHTGGTITETGLAGDIVFNGTGVQTFSSTGGTVSQTINFSVSDEAFLQMSDAGTVVSGPGTFTINSGGTLGIKSADGIETSGTTGNIQTTDRVFNDGANYVYNGSSSQVTGSGITQNIPAGLEINNSAGVRLSAATEISGLLKMTNGTLDLANTSFSAGSLTGSSGITNSTGTPATVTVTIGTDDTDAPAYSGVISNGTASSVALTKTGNGTLILSGTNNYTGPTTISGGVLELGSATTIKDNSPIVLDGGTLSTGSGSGFGETLSTLALSSASSILLGSGSYELHFSASDGTTWQTGEVLTIYGWSGQAGSGGTAAKIFFGSNNTALLSTQLEAITFYGYGSGADILSTGEIVPHSEPSITISSPDPAVPAGDILQTTLNNVIYRLDISVSGGNAVITSMQATLAGTYVAADLTGLKAWYSTDDIFTTGDILLSTIVSSGPGSHSFTPWTNQEVASGTTGYIFITADLPCEAITGHTVYVSAMTTGDITFIAGTKSGTAYAGGILTIAYGIPENAVSLSASLADSQTSLSWSNPGCFDEIMIAAKAGSAVALQPSGDGSAYTDNLNFSSGTSFDGGYIVYKGVTSPQTVTGLQNGITYYFTFFSRRGDKWSSGVIISVTPFSNSGLTFRSVASGNWSSASTWEMSYDNGSSWVPATAAPDVNFGPITVVNGHSVTVTSDLDIDQTIIEAGATVINSAVLNILGLPSEGYTVNGSLQTNTGGEIYSDAETLEFTDGSTYIHNKNGGYIPTATWSAGSNCNVTGVTSSFTVTSLNQSFSNFTWNCPGQTAVLSFNGNLNDIKGNFTVQSTGGGLNYIRLGSSTARTLNIGGNFVQTGGIVTLTPQAQFTMSIEGDFTLSNTGQLSLSSSSSTGYGRIYVKGDFSFTAGSTIYESSSLNPGGLVVFNGSGDQQIFTSGGTVSGSGPGTDGIINFTVNSGALLQMAEASTTITGAGTFTLSPGATLGITSADGITTTAGGLTGNIRTTAGRVYSNEANYIYNGTGTQVSGDGLPLAANSLTIAGTSDFTLTNGAEKNDPFTITQNLEIAADARMTVSPLQAVTVGTGLVNDGNLDLESDASGIASLMINGEYSGEGNAKSEIYMTGGDAGSEMWRWHYFAVPSQQSSATLAGVYGDDIMNYIDVTGMTDKSEGWSWYDGWDGTTAFTNLNVSEGYAYYNDNDVTMEINSGSLPSSQGTVNLNYGTYGWNLLGNSLTCGLNWDNVTFTGQVDHSVSFIKDYEEYYYVQDGPGVPGGTTGSIPPLQGFFVLALESGTSIDFSGAKEHNATAYYKGDGGKSEKGKDLSILRLSLGKDDGKDEMVIWFKEEATMGYDYMYDAEKWYSEGTRPQLYSVLSDKDYAINGIPLPETSAEIPLAFWAPEEGSYTINLKELENVDQYDFYLKDLVLNTKTSLKGNDSYTFSSPAGAVNDRFIIAIENMTTGTEDIKLSSKPFSVYDSFGFINIELLDEAWEGKSGSVRVVDISGRTLIDSRNETFSRTSLIRLPMENRKGVFVVEIVSIRQRYVTRVIIK